MWEYVLQGRDGIKGEERKAGREGMEGGKDELGKYIWQYSDLCCCQRSSGSIQKICYPWSYIHLVSLVSTQKLDWSTGKPLLSPEQLRLQKQLYFPWTSLAGPDEPKTTEDSNRLTAAFVAVQGRSGSTGIQPPPKYSTTSMDHTHAACPGSHRQGSQGLHGI